MAPGIEIEAFFYASLASVVFILICSVLFYEILAHVWAFLPRLEGRPRTQILLTIFATFFGHTVAVWVFGIGFYVLVNHLGFGDLQGTTGHNIMDYVYFSGVTYSSLGLGDVYPTGGLRLLSAVEAIMGLILIGWTITFTFLVTEKYMAHKRTRHSGPAKD